VTQSVSLLTTSRSHTARNVEQPALFRATHCLKRDVIHGVSASPLPICQSPCLCLCLSASLRPCLPLYLCLSAYVALPRADRVMYVLCMYVCTVCFIMYTCMSCISGMKCPFGTCSLFNVFPSFPHQPVIHHSTSV
jgi:hypothetical protein